jgi:hypothetical protein
LSFRKKTGQNWRLYEDFCMIKEETNGDENL